MSQLEMFEKWQKQYFLKIKNAFTTISYLWASRGNQVSSISKAENYTSKEQEQKKLEKNKI